MPVLLTKKCQKFIDENKKTYGLNYDKIFEKEILELCRKGSIKRYNASFKNFKKRCLKKYVGSDDACLEMWVCYWNGILLDKFNAGKIDSFAKIKVDYENHTMIRDDEVSDIEKVVEKSKEKGSKAEKRARKRIEKHIDDDEFNTLSKDQKFALETLRSGENVFLTGEAGTGKSYVLKRYIEECELNELNVVITAPTGIAAIAIGGTTIHRAFKVPFQTPDLIKDINDYQIAPKPIAAADVIIIDEISMARIDVFEYISRMILRYDVQLVVVGDFFQLPPVINEKDQKFLKSFFKDTLVDGFAFEAPSWSKFNFRACYLKEIKRQDANSESGRKFISNLNKARIGDKSCVKFFNENTAIEENDGIYILGKNDDVTDKNNEMLNKLKTKEKVFLGKVEGTVNKGEKPVDENLHFKVGARVMAVVNDTKSCYQNGSCGTITDFGYDGVEVKFDNGKTCFIETHEWTVYDYEMIDETKVVDGVEIVESVVKKKKIGSYTQVPLKLAYAITIHKSQGQTFDKVNLNPSAFSPGQLYVALSRVKTTEGLHLMKPMLERYLITSQSALGFYKNIDNLFDASVILNNLAQMPVDEINECPLRIKEYLMALKGLCDSNFDLGSLRI